MQSYNTEFTDTYENHRLQDPEVNSQFSLTIIQLRENTLHYIQFFSMALLKVTASTAKVRKQCLDMIHTRINTADVTEKQNNQKIKSLITA